MNELAFAVASDQSGIVQYFQMMGNRGGSDTPQRDDFPAIHVFAGGNGLENSEASWVGQGFRNLFDFDSIHKRIFTLADPGPVCLDPIESYFDIYRNNLQPNS